MPDFRVVRRRAEIVEYSATIEAKDEDEAQERFQDMWESANLDIQRVTVRADMTDQIVHRDVTDSGTTGQVVHRIPESEDEEEPHGTPV